MRHLVSSEIERARFAKWVMEATPLQENLTWIERRLAIEFGGHTYLLEKDQIFQCARCGHYDPKWSSTVVLSYFEETLGIKPIEIEITCTVAVVE